MKKQIIKTVIFFAVWQFLLLFILLGASFIFGLVGDSVLVFGFTLLPFPLIFFTSVCFSADEGITKYKLYFSPLALLIIIPISLFYTKGFHLEYVFYTNEMTGVIIVTFLLLSYLALGIAVAFLTKRIIRKVKRHRNFTCLGVLLVISILVAMMIKPTFKMICSFGSSFGSSFGDDQTVEANTDNLKYSRFTSVLTSELQPNQNLIWCATYQLCWDLLYDFMQGPVKPVKPLPLAKQLNRERFDPKNIDSSIYIAEISDKKSDFSTSLKEKFVFDHKAKLIDKMPKEHPLRIFFYSYLECNLPFEWKFQRSKYAMSFGEKKSKVASFGIRGYSIGSMKDQHCIEQIVIKYCEKEEAVIELLTEKIDHHLILAKVTPKKTIQATIQYVDSLIKQGKQYDYFFDPRIVVDIPVIDFDLTNNYPELQNIEIGSNVVIEESVQRIKFKLNESGAFVLSEAYISLGLGGGSVSHLIFDQPFLLMLRYKNSKYPYFTVWIGNAELLMKSTKPTILEYYQIKQANN